MIDEKFSPEEEHAFTLVRRSVALACAIHISKGAVMSSKWDVIERAKHYETYLETGKGDLSDDSPSR